MPIRLIIMHIICCIAALTNNTRSRRVQNIPISTPRQPHPCASKSKDRRQLQNNIDPFAPLQRVPRNTKWQSSFAKSTPKGSVADRHGSRHQKCLAAEMKAKDAQGKRLLLEFELIGFLPWVLHLPNLFAIQQPSVSLHLCEAAFMMRSLQG